MASRARKVPREEWERHKKTIRDLVYDERLPLSTKGDGDSVKSRLQTKHHFTVSLSQLEAYIKSCEDLESRHVKKEEWQAIHVRLEKLSAMGIAARVSLSGRVFTRAQLSRSKRRADALYGDEHLDVQKFPFPRTVLIETQGQNEDWVILTDDDVFTLFDPFRIFTDHNSLLVNVPMLEGNREDVAAHHLELGTGHSNSAPEVDNLPPSADMLLPFGHQALIPYHPSSQYAEGIWPSLSHQPLHSVRIPANELDLSVFSMQSPGQWPSAYSTRYLVQDPQFSQLLGAVLATSRWYIRSEAQSIQTIGNGDNQERRLDRRHSPLSQISLVQSLLLESSKYLTRKSDARSLEKLPSSHDVHDRLLSLLPDHMQQDKSGTNEAIVAGDADSNLPFYTALLYSIANGFAGLQEIPPGAILRLLKQNHRMSDQIIECLRSCSPAQARCLSDNLFKAAIEACDEEAVTFIIETTRDLQCSIDVNDIACKINNTGRSYTAIELAAKSGHLGIVQVLLAADADVNKTYESSERGQPEGALECAICTGNQYKLDFAKDQPVHMTIVVAILDHGAKLRLKLFEALIWHNPVALLRELFLRLPANDHWQFFPWHHKAFSTNRHMIGLPALIAGKLENILATEIIKRLLEQCSETDCMRCVKDHEELERTLCIAVRRANRELALFLLPFTNRQNGALAAAIRSGNVELIELFILKGPGAGSLLFCVDGHKKCPLNCTARSTPLAEAIRAQDQDLLQDLESHGFLIHINDLDLECAINAAALVGDCVHLVKMLQLIQIKKSVNVKSALCAAICANDMRMVMLLLESGCLCAETYQDFGVVPKHESIPLFLALDTKNLAALHAIIEAEITGDVNYIHKKMGCKSVLELAALWGDMSVVEDMISLGADLDIGLENTALGVALKSKNTEMIILLLEAGASPDACCRSGSESPLAIAIDSANRDAMQLLLQFGASDADERAFRVALTMSQEVFDVLLQAFSCRYPRGLRGFGGYLLRVALDQRDAMLLKRMLGAHFDTKCFNPYENHWECNILGYAIMLGSTESGVPDVTEELINREDLNSIVFRKTRFTFKGKDYSEQETALLVAIGTRNEQLVTRLLDTGADPQRQARMGVKHTPLQRACEIGSYKMVKLLLDHKARVDDGPAYSRGRTALQLAARTGSIKIAELLIQCGALVHEPPAKLNGQTAFEEAAGNGRLEMLRLLWDTVDGLGFDSAQIESAKSLALAGGHRGCAEYISNLWAVHVPFDMYL
ncbi:hypothetical protein VTL71DRAFT_2955 [Oculimacula yallundae]|uniref:Clr5 domain-containing protein n=1 Tax=Oculimacula yallundae TaxID=86028 RepID=A0ABR4C6X1_9HELO